MLEGLCSAYWDRGQPGELRGAINAHRLSVHGRSSKSTEEFAMAGSGVQSGNITPRFARLLRYFISRYRFARGEALRDLRTCYFCIDM